MTKTDQLLESVNSDLLILERDSLYPIIEDRMDTYLEIYHDICTHSLNGDYDNPIIDYHLDILNFFKKSPKDICLISQGNLQFKSVPIINRMISKIQNNFLHKDYLEYDYIGDEYTKGLFYKKKGRKIVIEKRDISGVSIYFLPSQWKLKGTNLLQTYSSKSLALNNE